MRVKVLREAGVDEALLGLSLSYGKEPNITVANRLAHKQGGHNKFLESIVVWLDITAARYWWQQFDTYRVGTTKQSESTMHTLLRDNLTQEDFEDGIHEGFLDSLNYWRLMKDWVTLKRHLPESFLQRRIVCTNYKVLQNMETQRRSHRLEEWQYFLDELQGQLGAPEWVKK